MSAAELFVQGANVCGFGGMWLAGRRRRVGWALGCVSEVLWALYACLSHTVGLYPWCMIWALIYGINWTRWRGTGWQRIES